MSKEKYYITTAIAYTSGKPHIGNNYEIVLADSIARYKRAEGYDVYFQTGTDEHGQKIELKANEAGVTPKEFVDKVAGQIKDMCDLLNISYDHFIRTTDDYHEKQVQKIFKKFYEQGDIYKGKYEGMYCQECEAFYTKSQLSEDGKCPVCGHDVKPMTEEAYFFKMSKYADKLIKYIEDHPEFIQPESRKNEMINNFLKPGLQDLCVSRTSFSWGIPVDFDPKHVVYVWIDALTNYITGLGYDCDGNHDELYKKYWPADLHLIGKDIIRFHTIYWPIMLMALGEPLPKQVFGHPWLLTGDSKNKYFAGLVQNPGVNEPVDEDLKSVVMNTVKLIDEKMDELRVADSLDLILDLFKRCNKYVDETMPWALAKDPEKTGRLATVLYNLLESVRIGGILLRPYLPETSEKILSSLNTQKTSYDDVHSFGLLETEMNITDSPSILFARLNEKEVAEKVAVIQERIQAERKVEKKKEVPQCTIEDFSKLDLRVGKVLSCERHPDADKLFVLKVDIGEEKPRQIVSGLAGSYTPGQMMGKYIVVIANLQPVKLRGVESCGMLLAGKNDKEVAVVEVNGLQPGTKIS